MAGEDDALAKVSPLLEIAGNWGGFLAYPDESITGRLRQHEKTGAAIGHRRLCGTSGGTVFAYAAR